MWKLLIAEDETIIRKGLRNAVTWEDYSIDVIDEAEDGEVALEIAKKQKSDILFIDINMPFLNGLELIEQLSGNLPESIFIVITGYDEFGYAQQAIKMGAFDYLLKPVKKGELAKTIKNATQELEKNSRNKQRDLQLKRNNQLLKERFLQNWSLGLSSDEKVVQQCQLLDIKLEGNIGISIFKVIKEIDVSGTEHSWSDVLIALKNIIGDIVKPYPFTELFEDQMGNIVVLIPGIHMEQLLKLNREIKNQSERILGKIIVFVEKVIASYLDFAHQFKSLTEEMNSESSFSPMVALAKDYIDHRYFENTISLQQVADNVQASPTYLSKQIKNELGVSFVQYLTKVRINKALMILKDPYLKIYEIAEMVGYSTQHYFCSAFKKVVGTSPTVYRNGAERSE